MISRNILIQFILIALITSVGWLLSPNIIKPLGACFSMFLRFAIAGSMLILVGVLRKEKIKIDSGFFVISILLYSINMVCIAKAILYNPPGLVSSVMAMITLPSLFFNFIILGKKPEIKKIIGVLIMSVGVFILYNSHGLARGEDYTVYGLLWAIGGLLLCSLGSVLVYKKIDSQKTALFQGGTMLTGSFMLLLFSFFDNSYLNFTNFNITSNFIYSLVIIGLITTGYLYLSYYDLVGKTDNIFASYIWYVVPLITLTLGAFLGKNILSIESVFGACLIIVGGIVANKSSSH